MSPVPLATNHQDEDRASLRVCTECFNDAALKQFVRHQGAPGKCDFCGATDVVAAAWEVTGDFVLESLEAEWNMYPDEPEGWDSEWGSPVGSCLLENMIEELGQPIKTKSVTAELIRVAPVWYYPLADSSKPYARLADWETFYFRIKHRSRFFFDRPMPFDPANESDEWWPTAEVLPSGARFGSELTSYTSSCMELAKGNKKDEFCSHYYHCVGVYLAKSQRSPRVLSIAEG